MSVQTWMSSYGVGLFLAYVGNVISYDHNNLKSKI